ncbi:MAG TPA: nucleotidyltransferase domain-containing protein [Methanocorpusculum sp.]|nr:nucleotidyltransferase domain-containing protein [Methanocorpusculum sp.]
MSIREEVLQTLKEQTPYLQSRFGVQQLRLFGSVARGEDTTSSDIDLLYIFTPENTNYDNLFELHEYLSGLFHRDIDLIPENWSNERFLNVVLKDAQTICSA